jgi:hypothetical protein
VGAGIVRVLVWWSLWFCWLVLRDVSVALFGEAVRVNRGCVGACASGSRGTAEVTLTL